MNTRRRLLTVVALVLAVFGGSLWGARLFASSPDRPLAGPACTQPDCVVYDLTSQVDCRQEEEKPTGESRWYAGLSTQVDQELRGGEIVAYKILWSTGWSDWFVTGMNDLDIKFNPEDRSMRRMWSYFYDHEHTYIICR